MNPSSFTTRRDFLGSIGGGFAGLALAQLLGRDASAADLPLPKAEFNGGLLLRKSIPRP
jgi:hypothetical protein